MGMSLLGQMEKALIQVLSNKISENRSIFYYLHSIVL